MFLLCQNIYPGVNSSSVLERRIILYSNTIKIKQFKKMKKILLVIFTVSLLAVSCKSKQPDPTPQAEAPQTNTSQTSDGIFCKQNDKYFVVSTEDVFLPGDISVSPRFIVKYKTNSNQQFPCAPGVGEGDLSISTNNDPQYIIDLLGDYLVLDEGTGPGLRGLIVYNLATKQKSFEGRYANLKIPYPVTLEYWTSSSRAVTAQNCPQLKEYTDGGLGAAIVEQVSLDLTTSKVTRSGNFRCDPVQ